MTALGDTQMRVSGTTNRPVRSGLGRFSGLTALELMVVGVAAPFLAFPTVRPDLSALALALLPAVWLLRLTTVGDPWPVTPLNAALLPFAAMIPVGLWASAFPTFSVPKALGLVLGMAVLRALALAVGSRRALAAGVAVLCLLGLGISGVGILAAQRVDKVNLLSQWGLAIPRVIATLPGLRTAGVNRNQLAGVLALYFPVAAALAMGWPLGCPRAGLKWLLLPTLLGFLTAVGGLLLLTQSRSGWLGGATGLLALVSLWGWTCRARWKRLAGGALPLLIVAGLVVGVLVTGPRQLGEAVFNTGAQGALETHVGSISLEGRVEIWSRALYAMQDFPFTGCGLGAFRRVVPILYPLFRISPDSDIAHAHNIFLQTGVDLGFPGLIAYVAVLMVAVIVCVREARHGEPLRRWVSLGLAAGLAGLHAYGLTDALALGSKPGVAFWFALGLVAAIGHTQAPDDETHER